MWAIAYPSGRIPCWPALLNEISFGRANGNYNVLDIATGKLQNKQENNNLICRPGERSVQKYGKHVSVLCLLLTY